MAKNILESNNTAIQMIVDKKIEEALEILKAYDYIVTYGITWQEPKEKDGAAYTLFVLAKPHLDANNKRYEKRLQSMWKNEALSRNGQW